MKNQQKSNYRSLTMKKLSFGKFAAGIAIALSMFLGLTVAQAAGLDGAPYDPDYPSGTDYDIFTDTLVYLGLVEDVDGDGIQNDRCIADKEAVQQIVLSTEKVVLALAKNACDADLDFFTREACFVALTVGEELVIATEINIAQCDFQDGAVNAAEIEAGFENTVTLLGDLVTHDANLDTHDADIKEYLGIHDAHITEILAEIEGKIDSLTLLVQTPEGKRPLWPYNGSF